jgi:lysophospholipase L1-like esterase
LERCSIKEVDVPGWTNAPHAFLRNAGLTLRLKGANPRWAAGLWMPDGTLDAFNFLDGVLLGTLVTKPAGTFYFGNLITASHLDLNLSFAAAWTTNGGVIEVNNPTDKSIKAKIQTAAAITDRPAIKATVTVPAGSSCYVVSKGGKTEVVDARPSPYEMPACLQGRKRILFYGDSLTDGSSYPDYVVHSLNAAFPKAGFVLENSGKCGDTTRDLLRRFEADVVAKKPDVLSICIGANDANTHVPVPEYKTNLQTLVRKTLELKVQPILYLSSPRAQKENNDILLKYLEVVKETAAEFKLPLVSAYDCFHAWEANGKTVLGPDGLHHGKDGFPAMARAFLDGVGLKEVKLVEKVTPWPGALTDWEVSAPVVLTAENKASFHKLENAKDWQPFAAGDVLESLEWYDQPFIQRGGIMPLAGTVGAAGQSRVGFARTTIESPEERTAELQIGGAPPLNVYSNGELVWQQTAAHGYHPNADRVQVPLKKGKNEFVICTGYMAYLGLK